MCADKTGRCADKTGRYGSQLKNFVPLGKIGEGAFSSVFKVRRVDDGRIYALKKVKLGSLKPKEKQSALSEIDILASFHSPHIVSYREAFFDEGTQQLCIILEWANEGDILADIKVRKKDHNFMPESEIWRAVVDILSGLHTLHSNSVLHRDIKSANIFKSEGVHKLGDLNIAKICGGMAYTQTGTPYYASPEVWKELPYDSKSDIWSFGCVIYEMCQLEPPFKAKDMGLLFKNVTGGKYQPISPIYSAQLRNLVTSCLEVDPSKRMSSVELLSAPFLQSKVRQYRITVQDISHLSKLVQMRKVTEKAVTEANERVSLQTLDLPKPNYGQQSLEPLQKKKRVLLLPSKKNAVKGVRPQSHHAKAHRTQISEEKRIHRVNSSQKNRSTVIQQVQQKVDVKMFPSCEAKKNINGEKAINKSSYIQQRHRPVSAVQIDSRKYQNYRNTGGNRVLSSEELQPKPIKYYYRQQRSAIFRNHIPTSHNNSKNYQPPYRKPINRSLALVTEGTLLPTEQPYPMRYDPSSIRYDPTSMRYDPSLYRGRALQNSNKPNSINRSGSRETSQKCMEVDKSRNRKGEKEREGIWCGPIGSAKELPRIKDLFSRNRVQRMGIRKYL